MKQSLDVWKQYSKEPGFKKILKRIGYVLIGVLGIILISFIGLRVYFNMNKTKIVTEINKEINDNITGHVSIGDVGYKFLIGFPNFTVVLNKVEVKDSLFPIHKRTLLKAEEIEVRLNVLGLLKNEVNIHKIVIKDATIDLFKDKNGISNSNIFKPKPKKDKEKSTATTSIDEVALEKVNFISENQQRYKLFYFEVATLESKIKYSDTGWETDLYINTFAKSMAFNTRKGSFIKGKKLEGTLAVNFSKEQNQITVNTKGLKIGEDLFDIKAHFNLDKAKSPFDIDIKTNILWRNAYNLLTNNIASKLKKFDMPKPIKVGCVIKGNLNVQGEPEIVVIAQITENELKTPNGVITNCNFNGKFINNYKKGLGYNDANSAIVITKLTGEYKEIPINIAIATINNLKKPIASGSLKSEFDVVKMKGLVDEDFIQFNAGTAKANLKFNVDIVDLKINKPHFTGSIDIQKANLIYKPKNLTLQTDIQLDFTESALLIKNIKYQSEKNIVFVDGKIDNFLNLYYSAPEKMVAILNLKSPFFDAKKLLAALAYREKGYIKKKTASNENTNKLISVIQKCQVVFNLQMDKMVYANLQAKNAKFTLVLANGQLFVKNGWIECSGGTIAFDAKLIPQNGFYKFDSNVKITSVDIPQFLKSFKNFGIKSFSPDDIRGSLSATANVNGKITPNGDLIEDSVNGDLAYEIKNGALINFEPIIKVGKFAFPNRDVKKIMFSDLSGNLSLNGEKVNVDYFKVSSNVLNFDVMGVYSFKRGTNLGMTIPLRNPKDDATIKDKAKREELRNKGIVLHLLAVDGPDGKIKIKWGNYQKKQ